MKKNIRKKSIKKKSTGRILNKGKWFFVGVVIVAILLGAFLRHYNYRIYPRHGATFDEFAWTWLGINLIQNGMPKSWSPHSQYENREHLVYQGASFWIVHPYLEHPPLFGLVAGSSASLFGANSMYDVNLANIRKGALLMGVGAIAVVSFFAYLMYGKWVSLLATVLYATVPTIVVGSRLMQNENFFIPVWLLSLAFLYKYIQKNNYLFRNIAILLAALLPLAKVPWLVAPLSLCFILFFYKRWKDIFITIGITFIGFSIFILYGMYFDSEVFVKLWQLQTARYDITFTGLFSIFTNPLLVDHLYIDGWIVFGWFSIFFLASEWKKHLFILLPFVTYLFMYVFAIPDEPAHGWYRYPFYPFLIISIAYFLKSELVKASVRRIFFLLFVGLSLINLVWGEMFGFSFWLYRLFLILAFAGVFFPLSFAKSRRLSEVILLLWISLFVCGNIGAVILFNDL